MYPNALCCQLFYLCMILLVPVVWSFHLTPQVVRANLQQSTYDCWWLVAGGCSNHTHRLGSLSDNTTEPLLGNQPLCTDKVAFPGRWSLKTGGPS